MSIASRNRTELIDQALDGQSAEVKARVLAIIIRYNIDVRNEFFLIFVAIGHLLAIVEESPENWRALFDDFKGELDEWTDANLRTLEAIHQQGAAQERMSQSFLKLTDSILNSNGKTEALQSDLISLSKTLRGLTNSLNQITRDSSSNRDAIRSVNSDLATLLKGLVNVKKSAEEASNTSGWVAIGCVVMVVLLGIGFWRQQQMLAQHSEYLQWIQKKAEREECLNGIVSADEGYCQQYFN
ncbi:MAG: DUF6753 family protein [Cyanobacteria bacterium P01_E01_bin.43]